MIGYRNLLISLFCSMAVSAAGQPRLVKSLVPDMPSQAPDYFCTWNLQGYVASYKSTELTRAAMTEDYLSGVSALWGSCAGTSKTNGSIPSYTPKSPRTPPSFRGWSPFRPSPPPLQPSCSERCPTGRASGKISSVSDTFSGASSRSCSARRNGSPAASLRVPRRF